MFHERSSQISPVSVNESWDAVKSLETEDYRQMTRDESVYRAGRFQLILLFIPGWSAKTFTQPILVKDTEH
jgi:hypothetical protein